VEIIPGSSRTGFRAEAEQFSADPRNPQSVNNVALEFIESDQEEE
jgi:hypothetical protein